MMPLMLAGIGEENTIKKIGGPPVDSCYEKQKICAI